VVLGAQKQLWQVDVGPLHQPKDCIALQTKIDVLHLGAKCAIHSSLYNVGDEETRSSSKVQDLHHQIQLQHTHGKSFLLVASMNVAVLGQFALNFGGDLVRAHVGPQGWERWHCGS
jgi:hypothetical protein